MSPTSFALPGTWAAGGNLDIRWVDDNAVQTSPDQIVGLNNIAVTVPEPSTFWAALVLGVGMLASTVRRRWLARA